MLFDDGHNTLRIIRICAVTLKFPVTPAVRPTVAMAETASYKASVKDTEDVALIKIPPKSASAIIRKAMVIASST